jgi:hypothetical protein
MGQGQVWNESIKLLLNLYNIYKVSHRLLIDKIYI